VRRGKFVDSRLLKLRSALTHKWALNAAVRKKPNFHGM